MEGEQRTYAEQPCNEGGCGTRGASRPPPRVPTGRSPPTKKRTPPSLLYVGRSHLSKKTDPPPLSVGRVVPKTKKNGPPHFLQAGWSYLQQKPCPHTKNTNLTFPFGSGHMLIRHVSKAARKNFPQNAQNDFLIWPNLFTCVHGERQKGQQTSTHQTYVTKPGPETVKQRASHKNVRQQASHNNLKRQAFHCKRPHQQFGVRVQ